MGYRCCPLWPEGDRAIYKGQVFLFSNENPLDMKSRRKMGQLGMKRKRRIGLGGFEKERGRLGEATPTLG